MALANTLAYDDTATVKAAKSFKVQALDSFGLEHCVKDQELTETSLPEWSTLFYSTLLVGS
jgi:hypothetical protein